MPLLQASHLSLRFANGETLFQHLSFTLTAKRTGLVGRNGVGKSCLVSLIVGELQPTEGSVHCSSHIGVYRQSEALSNFGEMSIASFLGVAKRIEAIEQIEAGSVEQKWFDIIGEQWNLVTELNEMLAEMKLPQNPHFPVRSLSGGQLSRLRLWQLFRQGHDLLILDEPTNHLDAEGQRWLLEKIGEFNGKVLLISHHRQLLREMEAIWELTSKGLFQYGGNYDAYDKQRCLEQDALERKIASTERQIRQLDMQAQKNKEKAAIRRAQGEKIRQKGGQPKILLNAMRSSAGSSVSKRLINENARRDTLQRKAASLTQKREQIKTQSFSVVSEQSKGGRLFSVFEGQLPFGSCLPINFSMKPNQRVHLQGGNGSGKSTLLKVLKGDVPLISGELSVNTPMFYLDQHVSLLDDEQSMLECLRGFCPHISEMDARTLLAGIGFRRDTVFRQIGALSGGEKMKLAILIISHQEQMPLLLLDEPDNHLDISSKLVLASTLRAFKGAMILVSHDESFVDDCGEMEVLRLVEQ
ncbi:ABC-F family ATP-binding cassette domain-containing protein [Enterovibrio coralii]|uniref:Elongation factor 3 n=1 Tax=Enterovibrio coralii TaxID=294935 RepID=A0A135ID85_9GAMM|nr:ATP-binding cassette domain-containing protein [Enterovibrio coralii]KXF83348.1 elongation factor 3 [Enterovibrio coralii]